MNFYGRCDGLGNRLAQIIHLEAICARYKIKYNYIWNNFGPQNRKYDILIKADKVKIKKVKTIKFPHKLRRHVFTAEQITQTLLHITRENDWIWSSFSQKELLAASSKISPLFDIKFKNSYPIGIHIRGTDRILPSRSAKSEFTTRKEFDELFYKIVLATNKFKQVFICADKKSYENKFVDAINDNISLCNPICDDNIPAFYRDFFALTLCRKIYLVSRFSSYSICAALIGNIPIVLYPDHALTKFMKWRVPFEKAPASQFSIQELKIFAQDTTNYNSQLL